MILEPIRIYKTVIGVFFAGTTLKAARIENGVAQDIVSKKINNRESEVFILNEIISVIEGLFNEDVQGIGVGVPSLVDVENGVVYKATNVPSWKKVHLKDVLEQRFKVSAFVNNDANCFAIGEYFFGSGQDYKNVAGVTIGSGLGVGMVIDGRLYSGKNGGAGEFCSIPYKDHDYEYYCTFGYFIEKYGVDYYTLLARAQKGDKIAYAIFKLFGTDFGNALKAILYAIDPEIIIIGGTIAEAYPYFEKPMLNTIRTFIYTNTVKNVVIKRSTLDNIDIYGAAALCLTQE